MTVDGADGPIVLDNGVHPAPSSIIELSVLASCPQAMSFLAVNAAFVEMARGAV